jgi:hypothetical protein
MMNKKALLAVCCSALLLVACGGGDDDETPAVTSQVPDSASASVSGFIAYLQALVVASADTLEPVDVSAVTPPSDDTASPATVE